MKNQNVAANIQCTVIMPAFNEADIVGEVVKSILRSDGIDVWVIDDHSTDQTADAAQLAGARVIRLPEQLGAWGAVQTGMREALRQKRHCVVTMDADGQHDPRDIIDIIKPIRNDKADVVVASCPERGSSLHKLAWSLMRLTSGLKNRDLTSGYRALNHRAIKLLSSPSASHLEFQDVGVLLMLERAELRVLEHSVTMPARTNGTSKIFRSWAVVAYYMAQTLLLGTVKRKLRR